MPNRPIQRCGGCGSIETQQEEVGVGVRGGGRQVTQWNDIRFMGSRWHGERKRVSSSAVTRAEEGKVNKEKIDREGKTRKEAKKT
jgi:hypothetical protein